jgi:hypothetical protein
MAVSKGIHVFSSRTKHSQYSKDSFDLGSEDQEKRPSEVLNLQNSKSSHRSLGDLEARQEAPRREEQVFQDDQRSRPIEPCVPVSQSDPDSRPAAPDDLDELLADLDINALAGTESDEEVIEVMTAYNLDEIVKVSKNVPTPPGNKRTILDHAAPPPSNPESSKDVSVTAGDRSKNVSSPRSKNVSVGRRRSLTKDAETIAKIRSFVPSDASSVCTSSVSYPFPSLSYPSTSLKAGQTFTPANDNRIPVWSLTGFTVTAVCATVALLIAETPAVAFSFNLTPDAIADAKRDPAGFLDPLKRRFDRELKRLAIALNKLVL